MSTIDHQITFLSVTDLEATHSFYNGVLGFPLALDQGPCRIYRAVGAAFVGFCERPSAVSTEGVVLTIVTEDVDGWHERLTSAGVEHVKAPSYNAEFRIYQAFYRDPDGYMLEIQRFEDPAWPAA